MHQATVRRAPKEALLPNRKHAQRDIRLAGCVACHCGTAVFKRAASTQDGWGRISMQLLTGIWNEYDLDSVFRVCYRDYGLFAINGRGFTIVFIVVIMVLLLLFFFPLFFWGGGGWEVGGWRGGGVGEAINECGFTIVFANVIMASVRLRNSALQTMHTTTEVKTEP